MLFLGRKRSRSLREHPAEAADSEVPAPEDILVVARAVAIKKSNSVLLFVQQNRNRLFYSNVVNSELFFLEGEKLEFLENKSRSNVPLLSKLLLF